MTQSLPPAADQPADFRAQLYGRYASTFKGLTPASRSADVWWDHKYLPRLRGLRPDAAILELGCGSGELLDYLARRGFRNARGVDVSAEQVALARARGVVAAEGDLFEALAATGPGQLDLIVAVDVFEHLHRAELLSLAPRLWAALRPGGRLLVQTANGAGLHPGQVIYGDLTHVTALTPQTLAQLLGPAGFVDLRCYETGPVPVRLRGRLDVLLWAAVKQVANAVRYVETGKRQAIWTENLICCAVKP